MRGRHRKAHCPMPQQNRSGHKRDSSGKLLGLSDSYGGGAYVKLFVGSVPRNISEEQVMPMFAEHGEVLEVALIKDKRTGQQQGCCFVKYSSREEADRAIRCLNNQRTLPGGTAPVQVRYADGERERLGAVEHKLFVGCLNKQASEREIEQVFAPYGRVDDVYIMRDEHKQSRGCAFVKFPSREAAQAAIRSLNNIYVMRGCDQPLAVRFADPKRSKISDARDADQPLHWSRSGSNRSSSSVRRASPTNWRASTDRGRHPPSLPQSDPSQTTILQNMVENGASTSLSANSPQRQVLVHSGFQHFPQMTKQQQLLLSSPPPEPVPPALHLTPPVRAPLQQLPLQQLFAHLPQGFPTLEGHFASLQQQSEQQAQLQMLLSQTVQQNISIPPVQQPQQPWILNLPRVVESPSPSNWTEHVSPQGYRYYYNSVTAESRWEKPDELLKWSSN